MAEEGRPQALLPVSFHVDKSHLHFPFCAPGNAASPTTQRKDNYSPAEDAKEMQKNGTAPKGSIPLCNLHVGFGGSLLLYPVPFCLALAGSCTG